MGKTKIKNLEEIYLFSMRIKEYQIVDHLLGEDNLKDEVMKVMPVQKQTSAGQRTRFKAFVAVGDGAGHVGLGWKCSKEVAGAIRGAIIAAKCPWFLYAEVIGVPRLVFPTLCHAS